VRVVCVILVSILLAGTALGKGDGVGFWLEGKVRDVGVTGDHIYFTVVGRFWMTQYRGPQPDRIELAPTEPISTTVRQWKEFFAMTTDWGGGALRGEGELLKLLRTSAERGSVIRLELLNPQLEFQSRLGVAVRDGAVIRATDHDLR
jgi:hypothetical protein